MIERLSTFLHSSKTDYKQALLIRKTVLGVLQSYKVTEATLSKPVPSATSTVSVDPEPEVCAYCSG